MEKATISHIIENGKHYAYIAHAGIELACGEGFTEAEALKDLAQVLANKLVSVFDIVRQFG